VVSVADLDLAAEAVALSRNGDVVGRGTGADVPARSR
jgi:hypothetical protein